jgi:hypothetical protein
VGKRALEETSVFANSQSQRIHFWDAGSRQIKIFHVDSGGTTWIVAIGRDGDKWPWTVHGSLADGTKMEGLGVDTLTSDGVFLVDGQLALGAEKLPRLHDVYKKCPALPPAPSYEHLKFLEPLVGNRRTEYVVDGTKIEGAFQAKWAPGKSSLIWSSQSWPVSDRAKVTYFSGIIAWDPGERRVREFATISDGSLGTAYFEQADGKLVITRTGVLADGTKFTTRPTGLRTGDRWNFEPSAWTSPDGNLLQKMGPGVFELIAEEK